MTGRFLAALIALAWAAAAPANAAPCGVDFGAWLATFKQEAAAKGISQGTLASAFAGVSPDPSVLRLDRNQRHFNMSFEEFVARRVGGRIAKGQRMLAQHAGLLSRIEARFGVPGPVLVAIWGLETDFGANTGKMSTIRSLPRSRTTAVVPTASRPS